MKSPSGKVLLQGDAGSRNYDNYESDISEYGVYKLKFTDSDTDKEGSYPGNGGDFKVILNPN